MFLIHTHSHLQNLKAMSKTIKTFPPSGSQSGIQLHFRHGNLWQTK
jgi:hypothetical protein